MNDVEDPTPEEMAEIEARRREIFEGVKARQDGRLRPRWKRYMHREQGDTASEAKRAIRDFDRATRPRERPVADEAGEKECFECGGVTHGGKCLNRECRKSPFFKRPSVAPPPGDDPATCPGCGSPYSTGLGGLVRRRCYKADCTHGKPLRPRKESAVPVPAAETFDEFAPIEPRPVLPIRPEPKLEPVIVAPYPPTAGHGAAPLLLREIDAMRAVAQAVAGLGPESVARIFAFVAAERQ